MNKTLLLGSLACLVLTGCGEALVETSGSVKPEVVEEAQGIVNGTVDTGHPTVGKIRDNGDEICTGTLVGAKTVVTAAHCIESTAASRYAFILAGTAYAASAVHVHSGYDGDADSYEGINDIAVIVLKTSPGIPPTPIATAAPTVGEDLTLVGYGVTGENKSDYGTKRITTNSISKVASTKIYWMPSGGVGTTCYGDSGGPAFATVGGEEILVGVTSGGESPCETGYSWDTRVDLYASWVSQQAGGDVVNQGSSGTSTSGGGTSTGGSSGTATSGGSTTETVSGSVAKSGSKYFGPYAVAAGSTFDVQMSGTGDADLYVRFGAKPTTSTYDCRPYLEGSAESCTATVPSGATTAYVMVRGYTKATFSLSVTYAASTSGSGSPGSAGPGTAKSTSTDGTVAAGKDINYNAIAVLAGSTFKVVMTGSGDPDLYVRFGSAPTSSSYDCRPYLDGAAESCTLTVPAGQGQAYLMVHGYADSTFHLEISYTAP